MLDPAFLVAVTGLSLSGVVSSAKLINWFLKGDPKAIAQAGHWGAAGLFALSLPILLGLVVNQRWSEAIGLSSVMLVAFAVYGPRVLGQFLPRRRLTPDRSWPGGRRADWEPTDAASGEAEMVQRSIAVLEEYLRRTTGAFGQDASDFRAGDPQISDGRQRGGTNGSRRELTPPLLSEAEAWEVLGLDSGAGASEINEAHRRLMQLIHPDRGGSKYFAVKLNQAKETLLNRRGPSSGSSSGAASPKRSRRDRGQPNLSQSKSTTGG
jgi:hypothetical protein